MPALITAEDTDPVFNNLTFDARPGDFVIVTGENGSGKTTLLKLIKGLVQNYFRCRTDRRLRHPPARCAGPSPSDRLYPQHADFFQGTIFENLRLGNPMASQDDIEKALQMADVWNEIAALPAGLGTVIGRYGADALPSSLATRLSLARAYLHTAPVLLIDELPNALLSSRAGKNLKDYLARTKGKRTCIMVSYREDFINLADTLVVLRRGETPMAGARETITETINKQEAA
jgi:ATP-binding cassette subfamily C protein LapB